MNLHKTYPSLLTADLAAGEAWYTKLLGRGPDHRPMATLLHWELSDEGGAVSTDHCNNTENTSAGFCHPKVCRGRLLSWRATAARSARVYRLRSVFVGKY